MNIIKKPCPNWSSRGNYKPELIVIHIMDGTLTGTDSWFASSVSQVSAHYGIGQHGEVHQYVEEKDKAWHAGRIKTPNFKLYKPDVNPNLYTIGIEHEGGAFTVWSPELKKTSAQLIRDIATRWNILIDRDHIIGHYQIFSDKPNCPANNKSIIDELISLANDNMVSILVPKSKVDQIQAFIKTI